MKIDDEILKFLIKEEGFPVEDGMAKTYIPKKNGKVIGNSGLTFGVGIDIGQMNTKEFLKLPLDKKDQELLLPYVGKTGEAALEVERQLGHYKLPTAVAMEISKQHINKSKDKLRKAFPEWDDKPFQQQAVSLSLLHNFGERSLGYGTMKSIMGDDLKTGIARLRNADEWKNPELFPRRNREADLLQSLVNERESRKILAGSDTEVGKGYQAPIKKRPLI